MPQPEIMRQASVDLCATVEGRFSPDDWAQILTRAEVQWRKYLGHQGATAEVDAWQEVVREFHRERYWGYVPNFKPVKVKKKPNLGVTMVLMVFNSMVTIKLFVLWFGQIYSRSDEPLDKWIFFAIVALVVANYGFFLWRNRAHVD